MAGPSFSLILATIGRCSEIEKLFISLINQSFKDFEIILIDQSQDDLLSMLVKRYSSFLLIRHTKSLPGLSKARNVGLKIAAGNVLCFPDDDCLYPPFLLEKVLNYFNLFPNIAGISGCLIDNDGRVSVRKFYKQSDLLTKKNVWKKAMSATIFIKKEVVTHYFNEDLGLGANTPWLAAEETDFLLKLIENKTNIIYLPTIQIIHPNKDDHQIYINKEEYFKRALNYGRGCGKVLRLHRYNFIFVLLFLIRPLVGSAIFFLRFNTIKAKYYYYSFKGRLLGWRDVE